VRLVVDVRTDYVPGVDFDRVRYLLDSEDRTRLADEARQARPGERFAAGVRVGEVPRLRDGRYDLRVELEHRGVVRARRRVAVTLREVGAPVFGVVVVFTRNCEGVVCPRAGDAPEATECVGGSCLLPECEGTRERLPMCEAGECRQAADCPAVAACAERACVRGACLAQPVEGACGAGEYCEPTAVGTTGCRPLPPPDAGGVPDAGLDGGPDLGPPDLGMPDLGGEDAGLLDGGTDAGVPVDLGTDAGVRDAGTDSGLDAGPPRDLGTDAGVRDAGTDSGLDAGPPRDLGTDGGMPRVTGLAAGGFHTCALLEDGRVQCWGWNVFGQLGDGTTMGRSTPVTVTGLSGMATALEAGDRHTCALLEDGRVQCWGHNGLGQLGDGTTMHRSTPTTVTGLSGMATALEAGGAHTCALLADGRVQCWGRNDDGQLGDGTAWRTTPVTVVGIP
jgi:hypothetical protein